MPKATALAARKGPREAEAAKECPQKGETPAVGGKPSASVFRQALLSRKTAALGFGNMHCPKGTAEGGR